MLHIHGDNIDFLNRYYCEITGLYYLWKNYQNEDIVGLEHYRRAFPFNESEIRELLTKYDMIAHKSDKVPRTTVISRLRTGYGYGTLEPLLYNIMGVIKGLTPEYFDDCVAVLNTGWHYQCNMFICKTELMSQYCKWIFNILDNFALYYDLRKTPLRGVGYIVEEVMLTAFARYHKLNVFDSNLSTIVSNKHRLYVIQRGYELINYF